jgi:hypothetical protein
MKVDQRLDCERINCWHVAHLILFEELNDDTMVFVQGGFIGLKLGDRNFLGLLIIHFN